tara:strand:+ start:1998 stop:2474 length:477 start_codon:yes stop_codon:yes gene_type:complete
MWLDERTEFADDVDVSASAGTALIGDVIDSSVARDLGNGQPVYLVIRTGGTEIITGGSAGTLAFKLVSDAAAAIATDGTATEHLVTDTFVTDDAAVNSALFNVGGTIFFGALPLEGPAYERYIGILAVTATTTTTAGTVNAFLTIDAAGWKSYADATN